MNSPRKDKKKSYVNEKKKKRR